MNNLVKFALANGGSLHPLVIPSNLTGGTGLMNPSIYNDNGKIICILRHVNYTFYHSEEKLFQHTWGPLTYVHPENDMHLRTWNWYLELDDDLNITRYTKIDTSRFDTYEPKWDFVGLEDARLFRWEGKLYTCGVRRDTTPNGQGRMELCEIEVTDSAVTEVSRFRIPPPKDPNSYCEKNWMPVLDQPYIFIKWCNPTEVVRVNPENQTSETIALTNTIPLNRDLRGGSQVLNFGDLNVTITHEVVFQKSEVGRKDGIYRHRFIVWDKDWKLIKYSNEFAFMDAKVEFAVGMCKYKNNELLISFGWQDNAAYVLRMPMTVFEKFINEEYTV